MIDYQTSFTNTDDTAFPNTLAVNVSAPGAGDGTEFIAALVNDVWGRAQALMAYANLTPDGVTEAPGTAQILQALSRGYGIGPGVGVTYWKHETPATNGDRVLLLQGQVIAIASYPLLAAAVYCGDADNATAPAFYKTSDSGGTTRSTSGTYLVLPDHRGLSPKMIGNATVNGRVKTGPTAKGEMQEDQMQQITGTFNMVPYNASFDPTGAFTRAGTGTLRSCTVYTSAAGTLVAFDSAESQNARTGSNTRDCTIGTNFGITY